MTLSRSQVCSGKLSHTNDRNATEANWKATLEMSCRQPLKFLNRETLRYLWRAADFVLQCMPVHKAQRQTLGGRRSFFLVLCTPNLGVLYLWQHGCGRTCWPTNMRAMRAPDGATGHDSANKLQPLTGCRCWFSEAKCSGSRIYSSTKSQIFCIHPSVWDKHQFLHEPQGKHPRSPAN